jgi:FixJ family two-component response regulator
VRLSGTSGLDFQTRLADAGIDIPIIFITGHGDIRMSVRAMKAGAVQFLTKPFREQDLLDAVREALERDRARRNRVGQSQALKSRYESLSEREREILPLVTTGLQNKQIAHQVQLSEVTVKVHRANLMRKLQVRGLTALVKAAGALGVS